MSRMIRYMARLYIDSFEEQPFMHTNVGTVLFRGTHVPMIESISELMGRELLPNNTFAFFIEVRCETKAIAVYFAYLLVSSFLLLSSWFHANAPANNNVETHVVRLSFILGWISMEKRKNFIKTTQNTPSKMLCCSVRLPYCLSMYFTRLFSIYQF